MKKQEVKIFINQQGRIVLVFERGHGRVKFEREGGVRHVSKKDKYLKTLLLIGSFIAKEGEL